LSNDLTWSKISPKPLVISDEPGLGATSLLNKDKCRRP
jgi:hypothetical protein